jgi:methionine sulfoxide reductase heme-binding subunit
MPPLVRLLKPLVFLICLIPALRLCIGVLNALGMLPATAFSLGADPVKVMLHTCGRWTLNFLMITLCMTPLKNVTRSSLWLKFRRMFGLFAFFYGLLHFSVYLLLDQDGRWSALGQDIAKRPYITIGMAALLLLIPLAATSTARAQRRLGRRWTRLHRLIYVIAILGVCHFWWQVKKDIREPLLYAGGLAILLGYRLWQQRRNSAIVSAVRSAETDGASATDFRWSPNRCRDP